MTFDDTPAEAAQIPSGYWAPVRAALTSGATNPTTIANGSTVGGVALATGDRFVCVGTRADAGIYTVGASNSSRSSDANSSEEFTAPKRVRVTEGIQDNLGVWVFTTTGSISLGVTEITFSFLSAEEEDLPSGEFDNTAAAEVVLSGMVFDNSPAVAPSTGSSTTIYYGSSPRTSLTEGQAKSELVAITQATAAGNFLCGVNGYKYLAIPSNMASPVSIRDLATGFSVPLAGTPDGYSQVSSGLNYASLVIDGVTYRVHRSASPVVAEITIQVSLS